MPTPRARSVADDPEEISVSSMVSDEVGSSMIRIFEPSETALAISASCRSAALRRPSRAVGSRRIWYSSSSCPARSTMALSSRTPKLLRGSSPRKMFWATVSCGTWLSSWKMIEMPSLRAW